jgi:hypothetical protein
VAILHLGFQARRVGLVVRGSFAGTEDRAAALRLAAIRVADDARSPGQLLSLFESLAAREGFVLETEPIESNELRFYFWEAEAANQPSA